MLAFLDNMNDAGEARLEDVARSFAAFYEDRRAHGLPAEKKNCIFTKGGYSQKDVERLILSMPFKRYEDMHIMHHSKHLGTLQFYKTLVRQLTDEDYAAIRESCHQAIDRYDMNGHVHHLPCIEGQRIVHTALQWDCDMDRIGVPTDLSPQVKAECTGRDGKL